MLNKKIRTFIEKEALVFMDNINIAFITDKNYITCFKIALLSLAEHTRYKLNVYCILTDPLSKNDRVFFNEFEKNHPYCSIKLISLGNENINFQTKNHVTKAAFIKIKLPEILNNVNKLIYLDSDILILEDINNLWKNFQDEVTLKAVWNPGYNYDNHVFGKGLDHKTFNSGVMLLNLYLMREKKSYKELYEFLENKNHLTKLNDQAAFNAIFTDWQELPLKWNVQYVFFLEQRKNLGISRLELKRIKSSPSILHFTSNSKPWQFRNAHPYKREFLQRLTTIDSGFRYTDFSFQAFLKKLLEIVRLYFFA